MTHIPATYIGIQPGYGRHPSLLLYNLLMDIPGLRGKQALAQAEGQA